MTLTLVSHTLCPYVQRAAIVLAEKEVAFERRYIDLAHKPDWFKAISPLAKTPVLLVNGRAIFESAAICEYLDDTLLPRLHPPDALQRAQHRAWMEFGSGVLGTIAAFYNAPDTASLLKRRDELLSKFAQIEPVLHPPGPYFSGHAFSLVDAVFGPVFRYFDVFEQAGECGFFEHTPRVRAWRAALAQRESIRLAVQGDYARELRQFLLRRGSALSGRMAATAQA